MFANVGLYALLTLKSSFALVHTFRRETKYDFLRKIRLFANKWDGRNWLDDHTSILVKEKAKRNGGRWVI